MEIHPRRTPQSSARRRFAAFRSSILALCSIPLFASCGVLDRDPYDALATRDTASILNPVTGLREFRDCPHCPAIVELPAGEFVMGSAPNEIERAATAGLGRTFPAEQPQITVRIDRAIGIGKYEVTFAEWDVCVELGGCSYSPDSRWWGRGERPVINIGRADAEEYIRWLRSYTGKPYRLPSEAEWEYAARSGAGTVRHWGDRMEEGWEVCDGCGSRWDGRRTAPVGSLRPNAFGLHDMLGNVTEWVADCWNPSHEHAPADGSPRIADSPWWQDGECSRPVKKGSAWALSAKEARSAYRSYWTPGPWRERTPLYGFRVALDITPAGANP